MSIFGLFSLFTLSDFMSDDDKYEKEIEILKLKNRLLEQYMSNKITEKEYNFFIKEINKTN